MRYNKQPTDITTQLAMLKQRRLIVNDEDTALKQLASISYFRLASYWKIFETDETTHQFVSGTRLEDVISLYTFDRELRSIIFTAIQDIEVALRTRIIHFFSLSHGAFWFMDASQFNNRSIFQTCLDSIQIELSRSKEEFLQEHFAKYDTPSMPPVWKTLEVVSFGNLSKLYAQLCTLLYLEQSITPNSHIKDRLLSLLKAYPNNITRQMGFPRGWENELLWQ